MEKQPIDDLFARKLRDATVAPDSDVFGRLQSRMNAAPLPERQPTRKVAFWWYSAAAACVLFSLGWLLWPIANVPGNEKEIAKRLPVNKVDRKADESVVLSERLTRREPKVAPVLVTPSNRLAEGKKEVRTDARVALQNSPAILTRSGSTIQETPIVTTNVPAEVASVPVDFPSKEVLLTAKSNVPALVASQQSKAERTVIMTIELPLEKPVAAVQPTTSELAALTSPSFSQLFAKVKQLKNGEVLARNTPTRQPNEPRSRIGRVFNDVKESLRNENTLEP